MSVFARGSGSKDSGLVVGLFLFLFTLVCAVQSTPTTFHNLNGACLDSLGTTPCFYSTGTGGSATTTTDSNRGQVASVGGSGYVGLNPVQGTPSFSIEWWWIDPAPTDATEKSVFAYVSSNAGVEVTCVYATVRKCRITYGTGAATLQTPLGTATTTTGSWEHFVVTYDVSGKNLNLYRNGAMVSFVSGAAVAVPTAGSLMKLGASSAGTAATSKGGLYDNLIVHDAELSAADVSAAYSATQTKYDLTISTPAFGSSQIVVDLNGVRPHAALSASSSTSIKLAKGEPFTAKVITQPAEGITLCLDITTTGVGAAKTVTMTCMNPGSNPQNSGGSSYSQARNAAQPTAGHGKLSIWNRSTCMVSLGGLTCFGLNSQYFAAAEANTAVIGGSSTPSQMISSLSMVLGTSMLVTDVSITATAVCVIFQAGKVGCFGQNQFNVVSGSRPTTDIIYPSSLNVIGFGSGETGPAVAIAIGGAEDGLGYQGCALFGGGYIRCWGDNSYGQIGVPSSSSTVSSPQYVPLDRFGPVAQVVTQRMVTCARFVSGSLFCFGSNSQGRLALADGVFPASLGISASGHFKNGDIAKNMQTVPAIAFSDTVPAIDISGGLHCWCAVFANRRLRCWGANDNKVASDSALSSIGGSSTPISTVPYLTLGSTNPPVVKVSTESGGFRKSTCAFTAPPVRVVCWGQDYHGHLGAGTGAGTVRAPSVASIVPLFQSPQDSAATFSSTHGENLCVYAPTTGKLMCWGPSYNRGVDSSSSSQSYSNGVVMDGDNYVRYPWTKLAGTAVFRRCCQAFCQFSGLPPPASGSRVYLVNEDNKAVAGAASGSGSPFRGLTYERCYWGPEDSCSKCTGASSSAPGPNSPNVTTAATDRRCTAGGAQGATVLTGCYYTFDGLYYVKLPFPPSFTQSSLRELTIQAWLRPHVLPGVSSSSTPLMSPLGLHSSNTPDDGPALYFTSSTGGLTGRVYATAGGAATVISATRTINAGEWVHVALTVGNGVMNIYVDGVAAATPVAFTSTIPIPGTGSPYRVLTVGAIGMVASSMNLAYIGDVDEVALWSVARSQADIQADALRGIDVSESPVDSLLAYYKFDDAKPAGPAVGSGYGTAPTALVDSAGLNPTPVPVDPGRWGVVEPILAPPRRTHTEPTSLNAGGDLPFASMSQRTTARPSGPASSCFSCGKSGAIISTSATGGGLYVRAFDNSTYVASADAAADALGFYTSNNFASLEFTSRSALPGYQRSGLVSSLPGFSGHGSASAAAPRAAQDAVEAATLSMSPVLYLPLHTPVPISAVGSGYPNLGLSARRAPMLVPSSELQTVLAEPAKGVLFPASARPVPSFGARTPTSQTPWPATLSTPPALSPGGLFARNTLNDPTVSSYAALQFTVAFWVKFGLSALAPSRTSVIYAGPPVTVSAVDTAVKLDFPPGLFVTFSGTGITSWTTTTDVLKTGAWQHVVVQWSGTALYVIVDGVYADVTDVGGNTAMTGTTLATRVEQFGSRIVNKGPVYRITLAGTSAFDPSELSLAEVSVFDTALTDDRLLKLMNPLSAPSVFRDGLAGLNAGVAAAAARGDSVAGKRAVPRLFVEMVVTADAAVSTVLSASVASSRRAFNVTVGESVNAALGVRTIDLTSSRLATGASTSPLTALLALSGEASACCSLGGSSGAVVTCSTSCSGTLVVSGSWSATEGVSINAPNAAKGSLKEPGRTSCQAILAEDGPFVPTGFYTLSNGVEVYCEMRYAGGGWTLVHRSAAGSAVATGWYTNAGNVRTKNVAYSLSLGNLPLGGQGVREILVSQAQGYGMPIYGKDSAVIRVIQSSDKKTLNTDVFQPLTGSNTKAATAVQYENSGNSCFGVAPSAFNALVGTDGNTGRKLSASTILTASSLSAGSQTCSNSNLHGLAGVLFVR